MTPEDMRRRVAEAQVARLATVTAEGRPHVVPCCFALAGDTLYSAVDGKPKSTLALKRLDNLRARPSAAVLVDHYDDDWSTLWWVRVDGTGRIVDAPVEQERALAQLREKYAQYRTMAVPGPVVAVDATAWRAWP